MITVHRTSSTSAGNLAKARAKAVEIAKYIEKSSGRDMIVEMPIGGLPFRFRWTSHYDSLAQFEEFTNARLADPEYVALLASCADIFLPGEANDEIWRSL